VSTTAVLGLDDKARLDEYLTSVRAIETAVANQVSVSCDGLARPGMANPDEDAAVVEVATQMLQLTHHAMQCDLTRVAVFQMSGEQGGIQFGATGHPLVKGVNGSHHPLSHNAGAPIASICALNSQLVAELCTALDSTPEGNGTMLDNTIILYTMGLSDGAKHNHDNLPHVLIGGTNVLKTGQYAKFEGRSTNDLYVTLLEAFGIDKKTFGRPDFVQGVLPGILA
jgi:hypothetical protein